MDGWMDGIPSRAVRLWALLWMALVEPTNHSAALSFHSLFSSPPPQMHTVAGVVVGCYKTSNNV